MITSIRFGQWETNSSSVHQLVIPLEDIEIPNENLIIRSKEIYNDYVCTTQEKLDLLVFCITDGTYTDTPLYNMARLISMLKENGIQYTFDIESFKQRSYGYISSEIQSAFVDIVYNGNFKMLFKYLFGNSSFISVDNNEPDRNPLFYNEGSNNEKMVITDYNC